MIIFCSPFLYYMITIPDLVNRSKAKEWQQVLKCLQAVKVFLQGSNSTVQNEASAVGEVLRCRESLFFISSLCALPCEREENISWFRMVPEHRTIQ